MKKIFSFIFIAFVFSKAHTQSTLEQSQLGKEASRKDLNRLLMGLNKIDLDTSAYKWPEEDTYQFKEIQLTGTIAKKITTKNKKGEKITTVIEVPNTLTTAFPEYKGILLEDLKKAKFSLLDDTLINNNFKETVKQSAKELDQINSKIDKLKEYIDSSKEIILSKHIDIDTSYLSDTKAKNHQFKLLAEEMEKTNDLLFISLAEVKKVEIDSITSFNSYIQTRKDIKKTDSLNQSLRKKLKAQDATIKELKKSILNILSKFEALSQPKKEKKENAAALPFINSIPGAKDINAAISIFGSSTVDKWENSGLYLQFGGFTGTIGTSDETNINSLFIPENSSYAFFVKNNLGFISPGDQSRTMRFGINMDFYYAGKKINPDTLKFKKALTPGVFQAKIGAEYAFIKNLFSIYINANGLSLVNNSKEFDDYFKSTKKIKGFVDWGVRMLLDPAKDIDIGGLKIFLDLNFLINGGDLKLINKSTDTLVPVIKFGIRKGFRI